MTVVQIANGLYFDRIGHASQPERYRRIDMAGYGRVPGFRFLWLRRCCAVDLQRDVGSGCRRAMPRDHRPVLARGGVQSRSPIQMGTGSDRRQSVPLLCRTGADDRRLDRIWLRDAADEEVHAAGVGLAPP